MKKLQQDLLDNNEKLVFGSNKNMKLLLNDKLQRIYLAKNCNDAYKINVKKQARNTEVVELEVPNTEVGVICKKPFSISVIGLSK